MTIWLWCDNWDKWSSIFESSSVFNKSFVTIKVNLSKIQKFNSLRKCTYTFSKCVWYDMMHGSLLSIRTLCFFLSLDTFIGFIFNHTHAQWLCKMWGERQKSKISKHTQTKQLDGKEQPAALLLSIINHNINRTKCMKTWKKHIFETMYELECAFEKSKNLRHCIRHNTIWWN